MSFTRAILHNIARVKDINYAQIKNLI